jgi:dTDP-4-amino-4,6-dideoxygalactose transaminase
MTAPQSEIQHSKPSLGKAEMDAVMSVLASGQLAQGPVVQRLEEEWCRQTSTQYAACVGSGLGALRLSLLALGIGSGDEVIVPAYSCVALLNAVLALDATPVLADVKRDDWTLSVEDVRRRITKKTRALVAVHLFGMPAWVTALLDLGLPVIEDCAHGIGGQCGNRPLGGIGTLNIGSFYATKMLAGGEGGIVAGNDSGLIQRVVQARQYNDQDPNRVYLNDKMTDLEAALVCVQLARLSEILSLRAKRAARYNAWLSSLVETGLIVLPIDTPGRIWYRYTVRLLHHDAKSVSHWMSAHKVRVEQPVWDLRGSRFWAVDLRASSEAFDRLVSLPLYPDLGEAEQEIVCETFTQCLRTVRRREPLH